MDMFMFFGFVVKVFVQDQINMFVIGKVVKLIQDVFMVVVIGGDYIVEMLVDMFSKVWLFEFYCFDVLFIWGEMLMQCIVVWFDGLKQQFVEVGLFDIDIQVLVLMINIVNSLV